MFGLGVSEILIALLLLAWAFRRYLARRYPNFGRHFQMVFYTAVALILLAGILERWLR